jgi:murein L,D-transpeptidase YafK
MLKSNIRKIIFSLIGLAIVLIVLWFIKPGSPLPKGSTISKIVVYKSRNIMEVYSHDVLLKTYKISLGRNPSGDKEKEGDKRTPEGDYFIDGKNPGSGYHKNLGISYPNEADVREARSKGFAVGGEIKIHGIRNGLVFIGKFHRLFNWTAGCVAVTNDEIDELYGSVAVGTPISIRP